MKHDRWYNPLMRWMLRSPLHWVVSENILLIRFVGRKSGRTYCTPINYGQRGQLIGLISSRSRPWWHNLEGNVPVSIRLRGKDVRAVAHVAQIDKPGLTPPSSVSTPACPTRGPSRWPINRC